jgi:membrane associated rhomboid family serine protease
MLVLMLFVGQIEAFYGNYGFISSKFMSDPGRHWFTLFSGMFLHGGLGHLTGNMYFLFVVGDDVEDAMGHLKYLFFYLFAGVCASLASLVISNQPDMPHVGASGAISGVMGAYCVLCVHKRFYVPFLRILIYVKLVSVPVFVYFLFWFVLQIVYFKYLNVSIDFLAHITGFVAGALVGFMIRR